MTNWISVALPKGRLGEKVYARFKAAGYPCPSIEEENRKLIFDTIINRLKIRRKESAFSPQASQRVRKENEKVINFIRQNSRTNETIHVLINVSGEEQNIAYGTLKGRNLLTGGMVDGAITLKAWECAWVKEYCR